MFFMTFFSKCSQARTAATSCAAGADTTRTSSPGPNSVGARSTGVVTSSATLAWSAPKSTAVNDGSVSDNDDNDTIYRQYCPRAQISRVHAKII